MGEARGVRGEANRPCTNEVTAARGCRHATLHLTPDAIRFTVITHV